MAIVALAVAMAFVQEHRSDAAAAKLRALVKMRASVKRRDASSAEGQGSAGDFAEIASELLVPGDIVRLSAGDMVPADLRLLSTKELYLDQSTTTGEAMPWKKTATPCEAGITAALEASNLALIGASVTSGFATGVRVSVKKGGSPWRSKLCLGLSVTPRSAPCCRGGVPKIR